MLANSEVRVPWGPGSGCSVHRRPLLCRLHVLIAAVEDGVAATPGPARQPPKEAMCSPVLASTRGTSLSLVRLQLPPLAAERWPVSHHRVAQLLPVSQVRLMCAAHLALAAPAREIPPLQALRTSELCRQAEVEHWLARLPLRTGRGQPQWRLSLVRPRTFLTIHTPGSQSRQWHGQRHVKRTMTTLLNHSMSNQNEKTIRLLYPLMLLIIQDANGVMDQRKGIKRGIQIKQYEIMKGLHK